MQSTLIRRAAASAPWTKTAPKSGAYQSKFGPSYKIAPNFHGISLKGLTPIALTAAGFGLAAGTFAIFFFGDIPRVRKDILQKVPIIGGHFIREVAPEDNPY